MENKMPKLWNFKCRYLWNLVYRLHWDYLTYDQNITLSKEAADFYKLFSPEIDEVFKKIEMKEKLKAEEKLKTEEKIKAEKNKNNQIKLEKIIGWIIIIWCLIFALLFLFLKLK